MRRHSFLPICCVLRAAVATILAFSLLGVCRADPQFTAFKTRTGAMIAWNESTAHFTVELPGRDFKQAPVGGAALIVDGQLVQVSTAEISAFIEPLQPEKAILEAHRAWETKYFGSRLGSDVTSELQPSPELLQGHTLVWQIAWPYEARTRLKAKTTHTLFATRVAGDRVVFISMSVAEGTPVASVLNLLIQVATSLNVSSEAIDFKALQERLRAQRTEA